MAGARYPDPPDAYDREWAQDLVRVLEQHALDDAQPGATGYNVSNYTPLRTLDMATATATDIGNFLCTLIDELKSTGKVKE